MNSQWSKDSKSSKQTFLFFLVSTRQKNKIALPGEARLRDVEYSLLVVFVFIVLFVVVVVVVVVVVHFCLSR